MQDVLLHPGFVGCVGYLFDDLSQNHEIEVRVREASTGREIQLVTDAELNYFCTVRHATHLKTLLRPFDDDQSPLPRVVTPQASTSSDW